MDTTQDQNETQGAAPVNPTGAAPTAIPAGARILTRSEILEAKAKKADESLADYYLPKTGSLVKVRDLPFTDITMILGIPAELRAKFDETIRDNRLRAIATGEDQVRGLQETLDTYGKAEEMANAICIAAFVTPRLVMRESELDQTDPMVWLVSDVDIADRLEFMNWINRNREAKAMAGGGELALTAFPGPGLGSAGNSEPGDAVREASA